MIVAELFAKLGFKVDKNQLSEVKETLKNLAVGASAVVAGVAAIGTAAAAAFGVLTSRAVQAGDQIGKTAGKIGIGAESLQELQFAAERSGVSVEQLNVGIRSLTRRAADATKGNEGFAEGFKKIGISTAELSRLLKDPDKLIDRVADGMGTLRTQAERTAVAMTVAGDSGFELNNLFNLGSAGINNLRLRARALGFVLKEETVKELEATADSVTNFKRLSQGLTLQLGASLAPVLKGIVEGLTNIGEALNLEKVFERLRKRTQRIGRALRRFGERLSDLDLGFDTLRSAITIFLPLLGSGGLLLAFGLLKIIAAKLNIAMLALVKSTGILAFKVVLITSALLLLGLALEDFFNTTDDSALDQLGRFFDTQAAKGSAFAKVLSTVVNGIRGLVDGLKELGDFSKGRLGDLVFEFFNPEASKVSVQGIARQAPNLTPKALRRPSQTVNTAAEETASNTGIGNFNNVFNIAGNDPQAIARAIDRAQGKQLQGLARNVRRRKQR